MSRAGWCIYCQVFHSGIPGECMAPNTEDERISVIEHRLIEVIAEAQAVKEQAKGLQTEVRRLARRIRR